MEKAILKMMKKFCISAFHVLVLNCFYIPLTWAQVQQDRVFQGIIPAPDPMQTDPTGNNISLGAKIQNGTVELSDIPLIIIYFIDILTKLAGSIAVIFIIYGGFQLMFSGATEDKQAAKTTLRWAITGLIVTFLAWVIVNLIQTQLTS
jgi:hypothetical protein